MTLENIPKHAYVPKVCRGNNEPSGLYRFENCCDSHPHILLPSLQGHHEQDREHEYSFKLSILIYLLYALEGGKRVLFDEAFTHTRWVV